LPDPCEPPDNGNLVDAIVSLELATGAIKWSRKVQGFDAWTMACLPVFSTSCPSPYGPDHDSAQGAMLIPTKNGDIVAAGQKSGVMWGLDPDHLTTRDRGGNSGRPGGAPSARRVLSSIESRSIEPDSRSDLRPCYARHP
jgi:hypothetical protein